jgi:hypothetical protein
MLFDLEDYATTMRATTDALKRVNDQFSLGLTLPGHPDTDGFIIPSAEMLAIVNKELREAPFTGGGWGGPDSGVVGINFFQDGHSTASAVKNAFNLAVKSYYLSSKFIASDIAELTSKVNAMDEFLDANIELGQPWNDFWSACYSFGYYGKGLVEGDVITDASFYYYDTNWQNYTSPVKFKIMTQAIYDDYFTALKNVMEKVNDMLVLGGLEA